MKITPMNEYVLIRQVEADDRSSGGLFLPESAKEAPAEGIVDAVAEDATDEIVVGDRVIYKKYSGNKVQLAGVEYILIKAEYLLAKYVEADAIPE